MFKKLVGAAASVAMMAAVAVPALADFNVANVKNITIADSQTGVQAINSVDLNRAHVGFVMMDDAKVEKVSTGPAFSKTNSIVVVNANWTPMWH